MHTAQKVLHAIIKLVRIALVLNGLNMIRRGIKNAIGSPGYRANI